MLEEYSNKRNFARTPEPLPQTQNIKGIPIFVVHKHAARRLHYDLRLEVDGVLKSWAIPGGPSLNPAVKRLAVLVEDHPLEYRSFEGSIPAGEYGAGQVIIWDNGVYSPEEEGRPFNGANSRAQDLMLEGLQKGKLSFSLFGSKLKGSWTLVKMQRTKNDWLLIKHQDEYANSEIDNLQQDASVLSGLTIQDLKVGRSPDNAAVNEKVKIPGSLQAPFPTAVRPMLASLIKKPFSDPQWIFEPKLDGYRTLAFIQKGEARLISRNGLDVSRKYLNLIEDLRKLSAREIVLDGELVAIDATGRLCFQCLQDFANPQIRHLHAADTPHAIVYYVFDILYFNGYDLSNAPLYRRKELLKKILLPSEHLRLVDHFENDGISLFEAAIKNGLEGVIGKLKDSIYEPGRRSQSWLKIKASQSDEFVVGGYTRGEGNRADTFGSLLLGNYNSEAQLIFVGHVGTGFDDTTLAELKQRLTVLETTKCPFSTTPPSKGPATWVKPELVAEVKFAEKTQDGYLRAPVFLRLRDDKSPNEVTVNEPLPDSPENRPESPSPSKEKYWTDILEQITDRHNSFDLHVGEDRISLTNLDKALWPSSGASAAVTKRDLLIYLTRVSPYLLPHLKDRPLTLTRYPNGVNGEHFYQKHITDALPSFVQTAALTESVSGTQDYLVCNNLATLLWLGQLANIDLHTWFSSITPGSIPLPSDQSNDKTPDFYSHYPDFVVFDIDPYVYSGRESAGAEPELNPHAFEQTCKVALWLKEVLNNLTLNSYLKTSGKTGLHIYVPLIRQLGFPEVHAAAKTIASFLLQNHPQEITIDWSVSARTGKVFVDYNQNVRGKTLASVYSPRPAPQATVSTPLQWTELGHVYPTDFTVLNVPERLTKLGDIWVDILDKRSDLVKVLNIKE